MKDLKTFQAETMAGAIAKVKRHFGRNAVILHTRTHKSGGMLGVGSKVIYEVTAAPQSFDVSGSAPRPASKHQYGQWTESSIPATSTQPPTKSEVADPKVLQELADLKNVVANLVQQSRRSTTQQLPPELLTLFTELVQHQVSEDLASDLIARIRRDIGDTQIHPDTLRKKLARYIETMLPTAGPIQIQKEKKTTIIAMVGPTGVGKTTTIAKLAANFSLREGRSVGLITIDTFRIGAIEQLRTYGQIINVPVEVVSEKSQMKTALQRLSNCDVVLIDTAGRSQNDSPHLQELSEYLELAEPDEIHLVLASTCSQGVLLDTVQQYQSMDINRVVFTKLDEAIGFGAILSCLTQTQTHLSYLTTGQNVPEDIEVCQANRLARLIVHENRLPSSETEKKANPGGSPVGF